MSSLLSCAWKNKFGRVFVPFLPVLFIGLGASILLPWLQDAKRPGSVSAVDIRLGVARLGFVFVVVVGIVGCRIWALWNRKLGKH